jgi:hypothetical protein
MFLNNRNGFLVVISLVLLVIFPTTSRPRKMQRMQPGMWGGQHIRLDINGNSTSIDYDCAHGTIDGPLTLDSKGQFTWRGIHSRERPGPVRENQNSNDQRAVYTGSVKGDTMTLTVKLADTNEVIGTFVLTRGKPGRVFKCK